MSLNHAYRCLCTAVFGAGLPQQLICREAGGAVAPGLYGLYPDGEAGGSHRCRRGRSTPEPGRRLPNTGYQLPAAGYRTGQPAERKVSLTSAIHNWPK